VEKDQLAFLRGYLEGLDLAALSRRYLVQGSSVNLDLRLVKQHLRSIRETVLAAARRHGRDLRDARLILIDPEKLRPKVHPSMTLEQYREDRDPYEMYGEEELLQLYLEEFGSVAGAHDRIATRNERLRKAQMIALAKIEQILGASPSPNDDLAGWLHPSLASRFAAANITTLQSLVELVNSRGRDWHDAIPHVGAVAAAKVENWLLSPSLQKVRGLAINQSVLSPKKSAPTLPSTSRGKILPIEVFNSDCGIIMRDRSNILAWLAQYPAGEPTHRTYRREAERFLLFCAIELGQAPSIDLDFALDRYIDFLRALGSSQCWPFKVPATCWLGPRRTRRDAVDWRPFEGPLQWNSQKIAADVSRMTCRILRGK